MIDAEDELTLLLDMVARTRQTAIGYTADLRNRGEGDTADVLDGALTIIDRLTQLVAEQDALIQLTQPYVPALKRVRVH